MSKTDAPDQSKIFPYNRNNALRGIICGDLVIAALVVWVAIQFSQAPQVAGSGLSLLAVLILVSIAPLYSLFIIVRSFFRLAKYIRTDPAHKTEYRRALLLGVCVTLVAVCITTAIIAPLLS